MRKNKGFTLLELLLVIAIIAIIASILFVALDPLTRFRDSRDARRWADVRNLVDAIKLDQVDNGGSYQSNISGLTAGSVYMIVDGTMNTGCADNNASCDVNVATTSACVDLSFLATEGYMGDVPVSPAGSVTWDSGASNGDEGTGYTIQRDATGILTVRACESENTTEIYTSR